MKACMGRKILFVTTDQQRYDSLGCNGGTIARTPTVDGWAASGINFRRAYNQNTVCMPARSTMLTGQYVRTHGVYANGVALPTDAPSVAAWLHEKAGYRTALLGKAHFEPNIDPKGLFEENRRQRDGHFGPWRGFERAVHATHIATFGPAVVGHYGRWLRDHHPEHLRSFAPLLNADGGGDTGAPETANNPIPREWYHTDWVADRTIEFLDGLADDEDWFVWMSFPDPHHPWDPPASELARVPWRELDLPPGYPGSEEKVRAILAEKPAHWLACWEGRWLNLEGGPMNYRPQRVSADNIREINAKVHVMNELIDEACARVMRRVAERGWERDTDVVFTTDHGEHQGDFGFVYKGPFHTDALMRLPLVWRPAPSAGVTPSEVRQPVGQVDLAPTFCAIAGIDPAPWMQGAPLPTRNDGSRQRVLCEWDSQSAVIGMHLRSIYRDGWLLTRYEPSTCGQPTGLERGWAGFETMTTSIVYDGTEGELYDVEEDPHQWRNLWDEPKYRTIKSDLIADLYDNLPRERSPRLLVDAPA
jgi:arylsulfatase A-like enzyme